jgi:hypothetical protein
MDGTLSPLHFTIGRISVRVTAHLRTLRVMRTTVKFDADTAKAVADGVKRDGKGLSEVVNELIRRGMQATPGREPFVPMTTPLGLKIDVSNIADAIDLLEGPEAR